MNEYLKFIYYGCFHSAILALFTYKEASNSLSFYNILTKTTENNFLHLLHVSAILFLIYSLTCFIIFKMFGTLRIQEINVVNDNIFLFLTDILLVLSVFSKDIKFRNGIIFFIIVCVKSLVWITSSRMEHITTVSMIYLSYGLLTFSSAMSVLFCYMSVYKISILFLFAFEFSLLSLSCIRNICLMKISLSEDDDNRSLYTFYIDIVYLTNMLFFYLTFIFITSIKFKIPLHVFRSSINILERLTNKIKSYRAYIKLCKDLEKCDEGKGDPTCPICREDMDIGKKLKCNHVFHLECLKKWCERQQFCPICKIDLMFNLKQELIYTEEEIISAVPVTIDE